MLRIMITLLLSSPPSLPAHYQIMSSSRGGADCWHRVGFELNWMHTSRNSFPPFKESHYSRLSPSETASPLLAPNPTSFTTQFKDLPSSRRPSQLLPPAVSSLSPNCGALKGMF